MSAKLRFNYSFLPMGTVVRFGTDFEPAVNTFYLDIGNSLEKGVFDHHQSISDHGRPTRSTASILLENRDKVRANFDPGKAKAENSEFIDINIACHQSPDFDCYASVFILCNYLEEIYSGANQPDQKIRKQFFHLLADYADAIDSGHLHLDATQLETPYAVANVIEEVLLEKGGAEPAETYQNSLNRGKQLISFMMKGFLSKKQALQPKGEQMPKGYKALHLNDILDAKEFQPEIQYLKNDYGKYLKDVKYLRTGPSKIKLPVISTETIELEEVDAIFFKTVPSCKLPQHWARTDQLNSPSKNGFVFTFIPLHTGPRDNHRLPSGDPVNVSRVIIAVREGSRVSLYGLGEALEHAEVKAEKKYIAGQDINKWRSRLNVRWPDEAWCTNIDPWYDGRNNRYTIVDAPGIHYSLLSIDEIMEITRNYTLPRLSSNYTRHILPFSFASGDYAEICGHLNTLDYKIVVPTGDHYFLSYIEEYLFDYNHKQCAYYRFGPEKLTYLVERLNLDEDLISPADENIKELLQIQIDSARLVLFKYGVGFMIIDTRVSCPDKADHAAGIQHSLFTITVDGCAASIIKVDDLNLFNRIFDKKAAFINKIEEAIRNKIAILNGMDTFRCIFVNLLPNALHAGSQREIAYKLSDLNVQNIFSLTSIVKGADKFFYNPHTYACCYQGIRGTCMAISGNMGEYELKLLQARFLGNDFFVLLLPLHQRHVLLNMATQMARHSRDVEEVRKKNVNQLRRRFLEFMIRGWFNQVTNDDVGMDIFRRWQEIFENQAIFAEVSTQIQSFDEFNQAQMGKTMEFVSAVFFPLMAFGAIYGILADLDQNLPEKVFGCPISYGWLWLGVFIMLQSVWLCNLKHWHPIKSMLTGLGKIIGNITLKFRFKTKSADNEDNMYKYMN